jgi:hypothetical protein
VENKMGKTKTSKFIREYGMTIQEMTVRYNVSSTYVLKLHYQDKLHTFIDEQDKKEKVIER